jgi:hypothetical protein
MVLFASLAGVGAIVMASQGGKSLFVNGRKSSMAPLVKGAETYIPLSALKAAGAGVTVEKTRISIQFLPPAGRNERDYVEGVLGEFVSNEAWRVKVTNLQPIENPFGVGGRGYSVDVEVRNLLPKAESMHGSGLDGPRLIDAAANSLNSAGSSFPGRYQKLEPGGSFTNTLKFGPTSPGVDVKEAAKIVFDFRPSGKPKTFGAIRIALIPPL